MKSGTPCRCSAPWDSMSLSLGYLDSNQEWMNQNHLCCQLHHTPIGCATTAWTVATCRTPDRIWTGVGAVRGRSPRPLDDGGFTFRRVRTRFSRSVAQQKRNIPAQRFWRKLAILRSVVFLPRISRDSNRGGETRLPETATLTRSEERRVGKEWRSRWSAER